MVLGILACGPAIDVATALAKPATPYRQLARLTAALSAVCAILALVALRRVPPALLAPADAPATTGTSSDERDESGGYDGGGGERGDGCGSGDGRAARWSVVSWWRGVQQAVCTRRFARFVAFSVAMLPALAVLRNLDGGIYPKFMVRTFGAAVPKGSIYALNPALDLLLVPLLTGTARAAARPHFQVIRVGLTVAALSPAVVLVYGASLASVVGFVVVLTVGDALYNPRTDAYAMEVAPDGREGTFAGTAAALSFLAEVPAGLLGGVLLERFCSGDAAVASGAEAAVGTTGAAHGSGCDARGLFGSLMGFALLTPLLLWSCPSLFREEVSPCAPPRAAHEFVALRHADRDHDSE